MIMNILYPDKGDICGFGDRLTQTRSDRIGYMPEERGLYKRTKVRELLQFFAGLKNNNNINAEVDSWLQRLDLVDWANKKVETLSNMLRWVIKG